jgi:hypothetical protein
MTAPIRNATKSPKGTETLRHARVPAFQLEDQKVSRNARWLFSVMCAYADKKDECWISNSRLAERQNVTRRSVVNWVKELVDVGWVARNQRQGKTNIYRVVRNPNELLDPMQKSQEPENPSSDPVGTPVPPISDTDENLPSHKHFNNNLNKAETCATTDHQSLFIEVVGQDVIQSWYPDYRILNIDTSTIEISFPTKLIRDHFEKNYYDELKNRTPKEIRLAVKQRTQTVSTQQNLKLKTREPKLWQI